MRCSSWVQLPPGLLECFPGFCDAQGRPTPSLGLRPHYCHMGIFCSLVSSTSIIFPGPFAQYPPGKPAEKEEIQAGIPSCKAMQTNANTCKFMPTPANLPCLSRKVLGEGYHQVPAPLFPYPMVEGGSRAQTDTRAEAPSLSTYCVQGPAPGAGYTAGPR